MVVEIKRGKENNIDNWLYYIKLLKHKNRKTKN